MTRLAYKDTRNYAPLDATLGIDLVTGKEVSADDLAPEGYEAMPQCRNCAHYAPKDDLLGVCNADVLQTEIDTKPYRKDKFFAYAEMAALTCEGYKQKT
jgi:hypothetical protein